MGKFKFTRFLLTLINSEYEKFHTGLFEGIQPIRSQDQALVGHWLARNQLDAIRQFGISIGCRHPSYVFLTAKPMWR